MAIIKIKPLSTVTVAPHKSLSVVVKFNVFAITSPRSRTRRDHPSPRVDRGNVTSKVSDIGMRKTLAVVVNFNVFAM